METLSNDLLSLIAAFEEGLDAEALAFDDDDVYEWEQCLSYTGEDDDEV